ncbi:hypothetical protein C0J52_25330 [Blattella germanica]|nr:hypothetical protein C0J52_25330 [Blattella germanica]
MSPVNKKGKVIHSECREIIENIICDQESRQKQISFSVTSETERAAKYAGVGLSVSIIKAIQRQIKNERPQDASHHFELRESAVQDPAKLKHRRF